VERSVEIPIPRLVASIVGMLAVFGIALFGAAGTVRWTAAWIFLALFGLFTVAITAWLMRHDPALLSERMTGIGSAGQKRWDRVFFAVMNAGFLGWLALMGLDAVRFGWSHVPAWARAIGAAALVGSFWLFYLVFRENTFLSPAVRIQDERGQTVVDTGPYRHVRHPMYAAAIPMTAGAALLLGSWWGLVGAAAIVAGIGWRAVREERELAAALPGYRDYMRRVRYRLVPGIW